MKIIVDRENRATIATGYYNGKKIKSVCLCRNEDEFDEEFGIKLAKKKWKLKLTIAKRKNINRIIKNLEKLIESLSIEDEILLENQFNQKDDIAEFIEDYFEETSKNTINKEYTLPCRHRIMCTEGMMCCAHLAEGRLFDCHIRTQEDFDKLEYKCDKQYD